MLNSDLGGCMSGITNGNDCAPRVTLSLFHPCTHRPSTHLLSTHPPIHLSVLSLSLRIFLSTHSPSYLAIYPSLSVQLTTYPGTYIPFHPSIPLSIICQSRYLPIRPPLSINLSIHPSIACLYYLLIQVSGSPSIHLSILSRYLSIYHHHLPTNIPNQLSTHPFTCLSYLSA